MSDRLLSILAVALLAESATGFTPWISAAISPRPGYLVKPPWVFQVIAILAGALCVFCVLHRSRRGSNAGLTVFFIAAVSAVATTQFVNSITLFLDRTTSAYIPFQYYLHVPANIMVAVGAPLLWGAAMARRDRPEDPRIGIAGRVGAGLGLSGFALSFLMELPGIITTLRWLQAQSVGLYPLVALLDLAARVVFLWSAIDMWRSAPDPAVCRLRMRRVHRLMWGVAGLLAGLSLLYFLMSLLDAQKWGDPLPQLWQGSVHLTLFLVTAFITSRWALALDRREGLAA